MHEYNRTVTKAYEATDTGVGTRRLSVVEFSRASAVIGVGIVTGEQCSEQAYPLSVSSRSLITRTRINLIGWQARDRIFESVASFFIRLLFNRGLRTLLSFSVVHVHQFIQFVAIRLTVPAVIDCREGLFFRSRYRHGSENAVVTVVYQRQGEKENP